MWKAAGLAFALVLAAAPATLAQPPSSPAARAAARQARSVYERGWDLQYRGDYQGALRLFDQALAIKPDYLDALLARGVARFLTRDPQGALADLNAALALGPNTDAFTNRAVIYRSQGQLDQALADYDQALGIDPDFVPALVGRGASWVAAKDFDKAIVDLDRAARLKPKDPDIFVNLAVAWRNKHDFDRAILNANHALELKPGMPTALISRASALLAKQDYKAALADYDAALANGAGLAPRSRASALYRRGVAKLRLGQQAEGDADINAAKALAASTNVNERDITLVLEP